MGSVSDVEGQQRSQTSGFSLLELLIALVVITGVATFSIWAYFARAEVTLESAAELLVEDLHIAQSRAQLLRTPVQIAFDSDGRGYRVLDSGGPSGIDALDIVGRRYDADAVFQGVEVVRPADAGAIRFDPRGNLERDARVTLAYRGETRLVQIDANAGVFFVADAQRR